jgi:hypothetical protein
MTNSGACRGCSFLFSRKLWSAAFILTVRASIDKCSPKCVPASYCFSHRFVSLRSLQRDCSASVADLLCRLDFNGYFTAKKAAA